MDEILFYSDFFINFCKYIFDFLFNNRFNKGEHYYFKCSGSNHVILKHGVILGTKSLVPDTQIKILSFL